MIGIWTLYQYRVSTYKTYSSEDPDFCRAGDVPTDNVGHTKAIQQDEITGGDTEGGGTEDKPATEL